VLPLALLGPHPALARRERGNKRATRGLHHEGFAGAVWPIVIVLQRSCSRRKHRRLTTNREVEGRCSLWLRRHQ
jgi:hypothetical protein